MMHLDEQPYSIQPDESPVEGDTTPSYQLLLKFASQVPGMLYQIRRTVDGTLSVPFTSDAIQDIFGCSARDVRDDFGPIAKVIIPEDLPRIQAAIDESARNLAPFQCEYRVQLPGQPIHWVWAESMPERLQDGSVVWSGFNADITERKQAEEAVYASIERVRRSEVELKKAQAIAHLGSWTWEIATRKIEWSDEMYHIFGIDPSSLTGRLGDVVSRFIHPDDLPIFEISNATPFAERKPVEYRIILPDQSIRTIRAKTGEVILDDAGNLIYLTGTAQDITELKREEEERRINQARLELAQHSASAGFWDWDMLSSQLIWSPELFNLFGLDAQNTQATFDKWHQVLHPDDREMAAKRIDEAIKNKTQLHNEYRICYPDGQIRWINAIGNTTYDPSGHPVRMAGICIDISERKQAEAMIMEQLDELRRWHHITLGREGRIIELKREVNQLLIEAGKTPRYDSVRESEE